MRTYIFLILRLVFYAIFHIPSKIQHDLSIWDALKAHMALIPLKDSSTYYKKRHMGRYYQDRPVANQP